MLNHHDWKIHRRLEEARKVYICPARGNCKSERTREMYEDLIKQGKEITFVRSDNLPKLDPFELKEAFIDKGLVCNNEPPWLQNALDKYFEEEMRKWLREKNEYWTPKVRLDTTVVDDNLWYEWMLWDQLAFGNHFVVKKENEE